MARLLLFFVVLAGLTGCTAIHSLHPVATEATAVYDSSLVGVWAEVDGDGVLLLNPEDDPMPKGFQLRALDADPTTLADAGVMNYSVRLTKVGDTLWANAWIAGEQHHDEIRTYFLARVEKRGDMLAVRGFDWDEIPAGERPSFLPLPDGSDVLLTAPTPELVAFLRRIGSKDEYFQKEVLLRHVQP